MAQKGKAKGKGKGGKDRAPKGKGGGKYGKGGSKGKGKSDGSAKLEDPYEEAPESGEPSNLEDKPAADPNKKRRRKKRPRGDESLLTKMKEEQDSTPAKRVKKEGDEHAPLPPSRIQTVPELQKLCAGLTSERMTQYVHLPNLGKDMLAAERVLGTYECSQKFHQVQLHPFLLWCCQVTSSRLLRLRNYVGSRAPVPFTCNAVETAAGITPGMLNPTLDQINRFETAMEAAFGMGGHSVSLLSDGVAEFAGVKFAGLPENFIPYVINLPVGGFDPITTSPLNVLVTCNRPSSLAIHERDLLLTDIHFLFICKIKQVPWVQAMRSMLRMRNIPASVIRRSYFLTGWLRSTTWCLRTMQQLR